MARDARLTTPKAQLSTPEALGLTACSPAVTRRRYCDNGTVLELHNTLDIAAAVLEGMDRGEELILPDEAARAAYQLKTTDRAAYDAVMRKQAARLDAMGAE